MNMTEQVDLEGAVVLRRDLIAEGYTDPQIRAMVKSGELHRVRHGSYVSTALWKSLSAADRHRVLIRAVLKRARSGTVVSHISAAIERRAPAWQVPLHEVHVTRLDGTPGRREAGVVYHCGDLTDNDVEIVNGIPVTRAARCAVEVTTMASVEPALITVNGLLHSRQLTIEAFDAELKRLCHWPHTLTSTVVLRLCDARIESVAESRTLFLCWAQHLKRPEPQVPVLDEYGIVFAYADFAWKEEGVFLEFDGRIKYELYRREGETLEEFLMREKKREERICMLTGWVCIRITWADLANPHVTARRIRRILESRRRPIGA